LSRYRNGNRLFEKGVKDYLVKPVEKEKLIGVVGKIVANGKDIGL